MHTPMNLDRYLFRQFSMTSLLTLAGLLCVVWLNHALRMLELVVNKGADLIDFMFLSLFPIPLWLMIALPMAGFIGVIWVINQFFSDRELIVMQAVGVTPLQFARVPIFFGALITFFLIINSVFLLPASFTGFKEAQFRLRASIPKILIQDKVFIDITEGLTIYVGNRTTANEVSEVFIQDSRDPEKIVAFTSQSGRFEIIDNRPVLRLNNGQRTEIGQQANATALLSFDTHSLDISQPRTGTGERAYTDANEDTIFQLLFPDDTIEPRYINERKAMGHYRLSSPFLALCLAIIASATMLHGRVFRDLVGRRIIITACLGIFVQILYVTARSATVTSPFVWPLMYLSIFIPCGIGILVLMRPLLATGLLNRISSSIRASRHEGQA
jgi:lipopolysaccharide export system permease protein